IKQLTGIDLSVFLPLLDQLGLVFTDPAAFLMSLVNAIISFPQIVIEFLFSLLQQLIQPENIQMLTGLASSIVEILVAIPNILLQLATSLLNTGLGFLNIFSPLNALNLFNIIPQTLLG